MSFQSKTYRVSFSWQGKNMWEIVTAWSSHAARQLIEQRYQGASSFFIYEEA
jgi:hypothetical protein